MSEEPLSEQAFQDIASALHRLRAAFVRYGMKPPISVELGSHDDGYRLRSYMPRDLVSAQPRMTDKPDPEWVCNIIGVELRWPGRWRAYMREDENGWPKKGTYLE